MLTITVSDEEFYTLLATVRFYQELGQGDPFNRSDRIHDLATNAGEVLASLDEAGIDALCERINFEAASVNE